MWPGPLNEGATLPNPSDCSAYDRIYNVTSIEVATYESSGTASSDLAEWPVGLGAPTVDANGQPVAITSRDQVVDLAAGERPVISGTQTAFWVMNDVGNTHSDSGAPLGIEVAVTAFAIASTEDAFDQGTFYRVTLINRNTSSIEDTRFGIFVDPDLGDSGDDYVGVDTTRGMGFVYNMDNEDDSYPTPPASGFDFLDGLATFASPAKSGAPEVSTPLTPLGVYNVLQGLWTDGTPFTEGGTGYQTSGPVTPFIYAGDPVTDSFWSQVNTDDQGTDFFPGDKRMVLAAPSFDLAPGASRSFALAVVFAQGEDHLDSITQLRAASDVIQAAYDDGSLFETAPPGPEPLATPTLLSPSTNPNTVITTPLVNFEWADVPDAALYRIQVRGRRFETEETFESSATIAIPDDFVGTAPGTLSWRVQAFSDTRESPYTAWRPFTYYRYVGQVLRRGNGDPAYAEVVGVGGIDPCAQGAESTGGCEDLLGNPIYHSLNSTGEYYVTNAPTGSASDETIGAFAPDGFEIRFTEAGGLGVYREQGGHIVRVPFEVWNVGPIQPGDTNDPSGDVRLIPVLYADASGGEAGTCSFNADEIADDDSQFNGFVESDRVSAVVASSTYDAFAAQYEPLVAAAQDECYIDANSTFATYLTDAQPIQNQTFGSAVASPTLPGTGTVIRMYTTAPFEVSDEEGPQSDALSLAAAYPNPSASTVHIPYTVASPSVVELAVLDVLGRRVSMLVNTRQPEGAHTVELDASALAPGVYVVRLRAGEETRSTRITVVR